MRSESDLSGSAIIIFGQEQGAVAVAVAEAGTGLEAAFVGTAVEAAGRTAVVDGVEAAFLEAGAEVETAGAAFIAGAGTIGIFPMIMTAFVSVLPQTPQLSSTLAVMVYVPGWTPLRSH